MRNEKVIDKTVKNGLTLIKILLSVIDQNKPILGAMFAHRIFPTCDKLVYKFETLKKRITSATTYNSRITKSFPSLVGISNEKWLSGMEKHSGSLGSRAHISRSQARLLATSKL
jgi:hypothetical protein